MSGKTYGISELDLSEVITAPGSYSFYCKIITSDNAYVISNISSVSVGGEYFVQINLNNSGTIKPGDVVTASATPQQYNPLTKRYVDVTGKNPTISWTSSDTAIVKVDSTGKSVKVTAVSGGTAKLTAKTTIDGKEYTGTKDITVTVPAAEDVQLMLEEDATYVMLDGGKLSDAVKKATSTTPSTFSFTLPTTGTIYSSSSPCPAPSRRATSIRPATSAAWRSSRRAARAATPSTTRPTAPAARSRPASSSS